MGYDPIEVSQAANKAVKILSESGRIASVSRNNMQLVYHTFNCEPNEEAGGANVARAEGTLGVTENDVSVTVLYRVLPNAQNAIIATNVPVTSPLWLGNRGLAGMGDDTGENICVCFDFENNATLVVTRYPQEIELAAQRTIETIHPINPKYLPGVCLPVVELSTIATSEDTALTAEESARMDEVAAMGVPMVLKFTNGTGWQCVICTGMGRTAGSIEAFIGQFADSVVLATKTDDAWNVMSTSV